MKKKELDIGIVVMIPEEIEAILQVFEIDRNNKINAVNNRFTYYYCSLKDSNQIPVSIAISFVSGKDGNTEAALCVSNFCDEWTPKLMCLIGIAAGIKGKVGIGDVIIPGTVIDLTRKEYENKQFNIMPKTITMKDEINIMLKSHADFQRQAGTGTFSIFFNPIGSDNTLIKDGSYFETYLLSFNRAGRGCEMEAAGFARACEIEGEIPWIIFRGISDFGDNKTDEHQLSAAENASITARYFIEKVLDISAIIKDNDKVANRYMEDYCEKEIRNHITNEEFEQACFLNQFASRYLQVTGQYETRIRFGKMTIDAAKRMKDNVYASRILIDDLGWTNYLMYLQTSTRQYKDIAIDNIVEGIKLAQQKNHFLIVVKGYRHLASISRGESNIQRAQTYLNKAKEFLNKVDGLSDREELEVDLDLSEAKLLFEKFRLLKKASAKKSSFTKCIEKATKAETFYSAHNDDERLIKVYKFLSHVYIKANNDDEARRYRRLQEEVVRRNGRVLFW